MFRDKVREFIKLTGVVDNLADIVEQANYMMSKQEMESYPPEVQAEIKELNNKYLILVKARLDEITEKFVDLYAKQYSEEEVDQLIAFHSSPIGKKQREVNAKLIGPSIQIGADFSQELIKQLSDATLNRQMN